MPPPAFGKKVLKNERICSRSSAPAAYAVPFVSSDCSGVLQRPLHRAEFEKWHLEKYGEPYVWIPVNDASQVGK